MSTCAAPDCAKPRDGRKRWCSMHHTRLHRHGSLDKPERAPYSDRYDTIHTRLRYQRGPAKNHACIVAGCERQARNWAWDRTGPTATGPDHNGDILTWGTDLDTYRPMCPAHASMMDLGGTLTHCPNGHDRAEVGTSGGRCAACHREYNASRYAAHRDTINAKRREGRSHGTT